MKKKMGRPKKKVTRKKRIVAKDFIIKDIDPNKVNWDIRRRSNYDELYEKVRNMKIGEAIEVKSVSTSLGTLCRRYLKANCKGNFYLRAKHLKKAGIWYLMKESA